MEKRNSKTSSRRADEKRTIFLPLVLILAGIVLTSNGFVRQSKPLIGDIRSEYQFNMAVVTNTLPAKTKPQTTVPVKPAEEKSKPAKPQKKQKKAADFCPT